jgi:hypothetical protein
MPMEAAALDKLIDKGGFQPDVALAIGQALEITIHSALRAANLVTVPMLDARFATYDDKMNERFEKVDKRFEKIEQRFEKVEQRFEKIEQRFEDLDTRFDKFEDRFNFLQESVSSTKVWAVGLYAGLVIALFGALAADHHWLESREDQRHDAMEAHWRQDFNASQARYDQRLGRMEAQLDKIRASIEANRTRS